MKGRETGMLENSPAMWVAASLIAACLKTNQIRPSKL
jgi:hypothetical protein